MDGGGGEGGGGGGTSKRPDTRLGRIEAAERKNRKQQPAYVGIAYVHRE